MSCTCLWGWKDYACRLKFEDWVIEMDCSCTLSKTTLCYECMSVPPGLLQWTACPFFIKFALIMGSSSLSVWIYLRQFSQHSLMPSQWLWCCSSRLWHCTKVNDKHQISLISCVLCLLNWHVLQMKYWHYHRAKHRCMINGRLWEYDEPAYNASCIVLPIGVHHCMISLCLSTLCAWHTRWTLADLHDLTLL